MDPFLQLFQEFINQEMAADEALNKVEEIIRAPENTTMLAELSSSSEGQELLAEWRCMWAPYGVCAPWERYLPRM